MLRRLLVTLTALSALVGCGETVDPSWLVKYQRMIGAVASVDGDEMRTSPLPGETLRLQMIQANNEAIEPVSWVVIACRPAPSTTGIAFCEQGAAPFTINLQVAPTLDPIEFTAEIPEDYDLPTVLFLGGVCVGGSVSTDIAGFMNGSTNICDGEGDSQLIATQYAVASPEDMNRRPELGEITFAGETWEQVDVEGAESCVGLDLPSVAVEDMELEIGAATTEASIERFSELVGNPPVLEEVDERLYFSVVTTEGQLERQYSNVAEGETEIIVEWKPPSSEDADFDELVIPDGGKVVRFWMVLRDRRGGAIATERALCLTR